MKGWKEILKIQYVEVKTGRKQWPTRQSTYVWAVVLIVVWKLRKETEAGSEGGRRQEGGENNRAWKGSCLLFHTLLLKLSPLQEFFWLCPPSGMSSHFLCLHCAQTGLSKASVFPPSKFVSKLKECWRPRQCGRDSADRTHNQHESETPGVDHIQPDIIWILGSGPGRSKDNCSHQPKRFGGCSHSLIWQRSGEIIWINLVCVACLSAFSTDWYPSGVFLTLLSLCVWVLRVASFLGSSFLVFFLHVEFLFRDKRRACVCR